MQESVSLVDLLDTHLASGSLLSKTGVDDKIDFIHLKGFILMNKLAQQQ